MTDTRAPHDGVTIRDARPGDAAAVRALTRTAYAPYAEAMTPDAWGALAVALDAALAAAYGADPDAPALAPHVTRLVAERDGAVVGSVLLFPPARDTYAAVTADRTDAPAPDAPELRLLAVAPAARGARVGERLVHACAARARAMGAPALALHTSRSMRAAIALYERLGFVRDPAHDFQPPGAELVMGYRLPLGA